MIRHVTAALIALACLAAPASADPREIVRERSPAQTGCQIAGDSIGHGTAMVLAGCRASARDGITSAAVAARVRSGYRWTIVSAGSNDPENPALANNLLAIKRLAAGPVIWIVPQHPRAATLVRARARTDGDPVVTFVPGPDGIHPRSYQVLAMDVLAVMRRADVEATGSVHPLPPVRSEGGR